MQAISAARSAVLSNLNHTADSYFCLSKLSYIAWLYLSNLNESCGISRAVHFINILFSSITQLSFPRHVPPLRSTPVTRSRPSLSWTLWHGSSLVLACFVKATFVYTWCSFTLSMRERRKGTVGLLDEEDARKFSYIYTRATSILVRSDCALMIENFQIRHEAEFF